MELPPSKKRIGTVRQGGAKSEKPAQLSTAQLNACIIQVSCFLLSTMVQFCARWAGKVQVESDVRKEHPPLPVRIDYSILFVEMWCREVGGISTSWMTDGTLKEYFAVAARLFAAEMKTSWDAQMSWLRSPQSEQYRAEIQRGLDRLRKTKLKPRGITPRQFRSRQADRFRTSSFLVDGHLPRHHWHFKS